MDGWTDTSHTAQNPSPSSTPSWCIYRNWLLIKVQSNWAVNHSTFHYADLVPIILMTSLAVFGSHLLSIHPLSSREPQQGPIPPGSPTGLHPPENPKRAPSPIFLNHMGQKEVDKNKSLKINLWQLSMNLPGIVCWRHCGEALSEKNLSLFNSALSGSFT